MRGPIRVISKGDWTRTIRFLSKNRHNQKVYAVLDRIAEEGIIALSNATPKKTGLAASSWYAETTTLATANSVEGYQIIWCNDDIEGGYNVILLIQYGHGLDGGGYVEGVDFINPALQPVFENFVNIIWEEVTSE